MAAIRSERRGAHLGRRSRGRATGRPRQPATTAADAGERVEHRWPADDAPGRACANVSGARPRTRSSSAYSSPIQDVSRAIGSITRPIHSSRTRIRCSTRDSPHGVRVLTDDELDRLSDDFVSGGAAGGRPRLPVRRSQALPRLSWSRALERARAGPAATAARSTIASAFCGTSSMAFAQPVLASASGSGISVFDTVPHRRGPDGTGVAEVAPDAGVLARLRPPE